MEKVKNTILRRPLLNWKLLGVALHELLDKVEMPFNAWFYGRGVNWLILLAVPPILVAIGYRLMGYQTPIGLGIGILAVLILMEAAYAIVGGEFFIRIAPRVCELLWNWEYRQPEFDRKLAALAPDDADEIDEKRAKRHETLLRGLVSAVSAVAGFGPVVNSLRDGNLSGLFGILGAVNMGYVVLIATIATIWFVKVLEVRSFRAKLRFDASKRRSRKT